MEPRFDLVQLFYSSTGRIGRVRFAAAVACLVVVLSVWHATVGGTAIDAALGWLVGFLAAVSGLCVVAKRLHDIGRSGWWSVVPVLAFALAWPWPHGLLDGLALGVVAVSAAALALWPGDGYFNRYGPEIGQGLVQP